MRRFILSCFVISTFLPAVDGRAQTTAADVSFDDSTTTQIQGADVQEALESTDGAMTGFHETIAADAAVVQVRKDCAGLANCFTDLASVESWTWNTRVPTETAPLLIDIGPGEFTPSFSCPKSGTSQPNGFITVRGSGPDTTRIYNDDAFNLFNIRGAMNIEDCEKVEVEALTIESETVAIVWNGTGSSRWSNVEVLAGGDSVYTAGWIEGTDGGALNCRPSIHYWFGSRIRTFGGAQTNTGYYVNDACSEHWFYGGEIDATMSVQSGGTPNINTAVQMNRGEFRAFGTALRSRLGTYTGDVQFGVNGVIAGGSFHMHGGIISVSSVGSTSAVDATGLSVGGSAHTLDTAFVVKAASGGVATRVTGNEAGIDSPLLWQAGTAPPAIVSSVNGEDLFVETDCASSGDCDTAGSDEPHLMIYRASCTGSPWFDAVTGRCRNVTP